MARTSRVVWKVALIESDMAAHGWGAARLAEEAGIAVSTVTRWLAGPSRTAKTGKRMAIALGYPVSRYVKEPKGAQVAA